MARQSKEQRNQKLHQTAMSNFDKSLSYDNEQRERAKDDICFAQVENQQWDDFASNSRRDRPRFTINKIAHSINIIMGDFRQNDISIKVRPAGGNATKSLADTYNGLIRNIESQSAFDSIQEWAFWEVINGGFGGWTLATDFASDDTFEQDIRLKRVINAPDSIFMDPTADISKAQWGFVVEDMTKDAFQQKYPGAIASDFDRPHTVCHTGWRGADFVRVADYYIKEPVKKRIFKLSDGRVIEEEKFDQIGDELALAGVQVTADRLVDAFNIKMYKLSGAEVLEGPFEWAGKFIPIVPIYGYETFLDGRHYYRGVVRNSKDAQRVYNYTTSAKVEAAALAPKDPYWITPVQAEGYEQQLANYNLQNRPFMFYNPDPEAGGPPTRTGAPSVQQELLLQTQQADQDIQATIGQFAPNLGDNTRSESGRAILAQQQRGDLGTFALADNLSDAVQYTGQILLDLIPRIYDTERQVRIIQPDGDTDFVTVNQTILDQQTGQPVIVNDLSQGKYDVTVDVGPSFVSKRSEALNLLVELSNSNPLFQQVATDLLAKNLDFPFAEELTERVRKPMVQQGIVEPNEEEAAALAEAQAAAAQQPPDPVQQLEFQRAQLLNELLAAQVDEREVQNEKTKFEIQNLIAKTQSELTDVIKTKADTNKTIIETQNQGGADIFQVKPQELAARARNMSILNQTLQNTLNQGQELTPEQQQQLAALQQLQGIGAPAAPGNGQLEDLSEGAATLLEGRQT